MLLKKTLFIHLFILLGISISYGQKTKIAVSYNEPETYVVFNEELIGVCPEFIKLDFAIGGDLIFFKPGFYSFRIEIGPENVFNKLGVELIEKPKDISLEKKRLIKPDTLVMTSIVTNMTSNKIQEIIDANFEKNNYYIGKSAALFPGVQDEIQDCRYKLALEIIDSRQIRSVYKAPRFAMASITIRWSLLDSENNKIAYYNTTDGIYFVKVSSTKGMIVSELMERVMKGAITEAQFKVLSDEKFINLINE